MSIKASGLLARFQAGEEVRGGSGVQGKLAVEKKLILKSGDRRLITYSLQNLKRSADGNQAICIFIRTIG